MSAPAEGHGHKWQAEHDASHKKRDPGSQHKQRGEEEVMGVPLSVMWCHLAARAWRVPTGAWGCAVILRTVPPMSDTDGALAFAGPAWPLTDTTDTRS